MTAIAAGLFAAIDGAANPDSGNWHFPYFNSEMAEAVTAVTKNSDVLLLGRVTYDTSGVGTSWPHRNAGRAGDATFAHRSATPSREVVRQSHQQPKWCDSEQQQRALVEAAAALKKDPAIRLVGVSGSASVMRQLLDSGLVDELHLFVHPTSAVSALKRYEDGRPAPSFSLVSFQPFNTGVFQPVNNHGSAATRGRPGLERSSNRRRWNDATREGDAMSRNFRRWWAPVPQPGSVSCPREDHP